MVAVDGLNWCWWSRRDSRAGRRGLGESTVGCCYAAHVIGSPRRRVRVQQSTNGRPTIRESLGDNRFALKGPVD